MSIVDRIYTGSVNLVQKRLVPLAERRLNQYASPPAAFTERLQALGLRPERMYLGAMVHAPTRSAIIMDDIERFPPTEVIECGAGNSTTWLLALGARLGFGLTSLENHPDTIDYIRYLLAGTPYERDFNLAPCGFTRYRKADGGGYWWYDTDFDQLGKIFDFVFIDGPMSSLVGRGGALYRLWDHLASGARIFVDDASRPHERQMIAAWQRDFVGIEVQYPINTMARIVKP